MLIFMGISLVGVAQSLSFPYPERKYDFVNYDSSVLYTPADNPNLETFFNKLDHFYFDGDEGFTVLHLGDSHIQAGVVSWCLRRHFESLCHDSHGDFGLLAPLSIAPKNNHPYYYVSRNSGNWKFERIIKNETGTQIGLSGFVAFTKDSLANLTFAFPKRSMKEKHEFTKVKLLHGVSDTCYDIFTNVDSLMVDCTTDFTEGYTEMVYSHSFDSLVFKFVRNVDSRASAEMHVHGVLVEDSLPNVNFITIGTNGASTESYIKEKHVLEQLEVVKPDLAIVALGVNDASGTNFDKGRFVQNYKKIVNAILQANPDCAIIFVSNNDFCTKRGGNNHNQPLVVEAMKDLSKTYHASLWNLFAVMGGQRSIYTWQKHGLANTDKIHFTNDGYMLEGDLLFGAILREYEKHLKKITNNEK
ncbi:MAG: hypothetical protein II037_08250 [Bacteroidales bacterium]|nr:hypothetical protein [Bacteroidales bacterium]